MVKFPQVRLDPKVNVPVPVNDMLVDKFVPFVVMVADVDVLKVVVPANVVVTPVAPIVRLPEIVKPALFEPTIDTVPVAGFIMLKLLHAFAPVVPNVTV